MNLELNGRLAAPTAVGDGVMLPAIALIPGTTASSWRQMSSQTLGVARVIFDPDNIEAEFAIVVRSDLKGKGLGSILLNRLIDYCRDRGTERIVGQVLAENRQMLALARKVGFKPAPMNQDGIVQVTLELAG